MVEREDQWTGIEQVKNGMQVLLKYILLYTIKWSILNLFRTGLLKTSVKNVQHKI